MKVAFFGFSFKDGLLTDLDIDCFSPPPPPPPPRSAVDWYFVCNMCTVPAAATRLSQIFGATEKSMTKVLSSVKVGFGRCCVGVVILTG